MSSTTETTQAARPLSLNGQDLGDQAAAVLRTTLKRRLRREVNDGKGGVASVLADLVEISLDGEGTIDELELIERARQLGVDQDRGSVR